jgi:RNA polymerase sigma factor (sigma-70 family)
MASFNTTRWSLIAAASTSRESAGARIALSELCQAYWPPLYAFARRRGLSIDDAQDETQSFFAELLEGDLLEQADPNRGRFRNYLLTCFRHFLSNQNERQRAKKRGGGKPLLSFAFQDAENEYQREPHHNVTAEQLYERRWALLLLDRVLTRLRTKYEQKGRGEWFEALQVFLAGAHEAEEDLQSAAVRLGLTDGALRVATHRLRQQYREMIRDEVAQTVSHNDEIDDELAALMAALRIS